MYFRSMPVSFVRTYLELPSVPRRFNYSRGGGGKTTLLVSIQRAAGNHFVPRYSHAHPLHEGGSAEVVYRFE